MTLIYLILSISFAQSCPVESFRLGTQKFNQMETSAKTGCSINVALNPDASSKRSIRYFKNGQFVVFTEVGPKAAGYRAYYVLPAVAGNVEMKSFGIGAKVKDSAGLDWIYDEKGNISTEQKCKLNIDKKISFETEATQGGKPGGFHLKSCPASVIIDSGFKRGNMSNDDPEASSEVRDASGKSCTVNNKSVYTHTLDYTDKRTGKKYYAATIKPNKAIYAQLSKECPDLDLSPLQSGTGGSGNTLNNRQ